MQLLVLQLTVWGLDLSAVPDGSQLCVSDTQSDTLIGTINSSSNFNLLIVALLTTNCACLYSSHQQELDMIPLMMQKDYSPKGWRKSQYTALHFCLSCRRHAHDVL